MKAFHFIFLGEDYLSHLEFETLITFIEILILLWTTNAQEKSFKNVMYFVFQSRTLQKIKNWFFFLFFFNKVFQMPIYLFYFIDN